MAYRIVRHHTREFFNTLLTAPDGPMPGLTQFRDMLWSIGRCKVGVCTMPNSFQCRNHLGAFHYTDIRGIHQPPMREFFNALLTAPDPVRIRAI